MKKTALTLLILGVAFIGCSQNQPKKEVIDNRNSLKSEFKKFFMEFRQGIHEIKKRRGIMWMFIFTVFASLAMVPVSTLFPLMTLDHFAGDTYKMSFIEITWGVGMLLGGVLMTLPKFKFDNVKLINSSYIVLGASFLFSGFLRPLTAKGVHLIGI